MLFDYRLCRCGHEYFFHPEGGFKAPGIGRILHCAGPLPRELNKSGASYPCRCDKFKQDNLKYLEQRYQEKFV